MSKKYTTNFLEDTNGSTGSANQVLVSTAAGIDWVDGSGSGIIGGPYLPLTGGTLTGNTNLTGSTKKLILNSGAQLGFEDATPTGTIYLYNDGAATSRLNIGGTMWVEEAGNVGIGTTSPSTKLHVAGIAQVTESGNTAFYGGNYLRVFNDQVYTIRNSGGNQRFAFDNTSGSLSTYNSSNVRTTYFNNSGSSYINGGNVGIGTTSPNTPLEVHGEDIATTSTTTSTSVLRLVRDVVDPSYPSRKNSAVDFMLSRQQLINNNLPYTRLDIRLAGVTDSSTPSLDVMSLLYNGNVGIGTTDPGTKLQVDAGSNIASFRSVGSGQNNKELLIQTGGDRVVLDAKNADDGTATALAFESGGSEKMRITSSGNVGIGTTSPTEKLEVIGRTKITKNGDALRINSSDANGSYATWENNGSNIGYIGTGYHLWYSPNNIATSLGIRAETRLDLGIQANVYMTILNTGNVGIGTTSPSNPLHVSSSDNILATFESIDAISEIRVKDNTKYTRLLTVGSDFKIMPNDGVEMAVFEGDTGNSYFNGGNVGIGTTSPGEKLEVSGNAKADTLIATDLTDGVIPYHRNGSLGLQDQKMFSDNTNIYIGPASPPNYYSRLTVEGSGIYTTDIEISGSLTYQEPTAASEFNGEIVTFGTFIETPAAGDLICFNSSLGTSGWREANNSTILDSTGMLGIAVGTTPANGILIRGFAKSALYNTSNLGTTPAGKKLYIDSVNGLLTTVIPTSNNVRIVGYVVEADATNGTIYFCPDNTYVEIA